MLKLENITKDYVSKDQPVVHALKGISLNFRRHEFVAILGPSGCGKTTLLNITGGLDSYTSGDLVIEGTSTVKYTSRDWDTYRNHSIGFVFQTYNLIPHINILQNVELALTISGISKSVRKKKAKEALKEVGLEGLEKKKPNQLSGGQMQRVAIARALVNDPEIVLADEPTGALDSETSVQIMELLKKVSKHKLVIMVTHNPDLANEYATRIVKMKDGTVISDSKPYVGESEKDRAIAISQKEKVYGKKLSSMSYKTAIGLSLNNLKTKKGRFFLTSFAGSIGIIGIALILSVSYGTNEYVGKVQEDALTTYPMSVSRSSVDTASLLSAFIDATNAGAQGEQYPSTDVIKENSTLSTLATSIMNSGVKNDLKEFTKYIKQDSVMDRYKDTLTSIAYQYDFSLETYTNFEAFDIDEVKKAYPVTIKSGSGTIDDYLSDYYDAIKDVSPMIRNSLVTVIRTVGNLLNSYFSNSSFPTFAQMIPNIDSSRPQNYSKIIDDQYDLLYGKMPEKYNEVVVIVDSYNNIADYVLYSLGLRNPKNLILKMTQTVGATYGLGEEELERIKYFPEPSAFNDDEGNFSMTFEEFCKLKYYLPLQYQKFGEPQLNASSGHYYYRYKPTSKLINDIKASYDTEEEAIVNDGNYMANLNIVGVVRAKQGITSQCLTGGIGYLPSLVDEYLIEKNCGIDEFGNYIYPKSGDYKRPLDVLDESQEKNPVAAHLKQKDLSFGHGYDIYTGYPFYDTVTTNIKDETVVFDQQTIKQFLLTFIKEDDLKFDNPIIQKLVNEFLENKMLFTTLGSNISPATFTVNLNNGTKLTSTKGIRISLVKFMEDNPEIFKYMPEALKNMLIEQYGDVDYSIGTILNSDNLPVGGIIYDFGFVVLANNSSITDYMNPSNADSYSTKVDYQISELTNNPKSYTLDSVLSVFKIVDLNNPLSIYFYPKDFESKDKVNALVKEFNDQMAEKVKADYAKYNDGVEPKNDAQKKLIVDKYQVKISDGVGTLLSSVSTIVNSVTYVLIAFVAISLIVSSVMISIITYISVIERTKEIGVLRSLGARKRDISSVFNAETLIIGATSGLLGVGIAALLDIPITLIIVALAKVPLNVTLPWWAYIVLPAISIALTIISGLVPSLQAAKKDPVIALRSE